MLKRVAEWSDGWIPINITPTQIAEGRHTHDHLDSEAGRGPASIEISVLIPEDRDLVDRFCETGADRVIVTVEESGEKGNPDTLDQIGRYSPYVIIPTFRKYTCGATLFPPDSSLRTQKGPIKTAILWRTRPSTSLGWE